MQEKKEFSFYLYDKPTLVIIDWYSLYNRYRDIDLQLFFDYLKQYKDIYQVRFYQGTIEGKEWSEKTIQDARTIGYEVITKPSKYITIDLNKEKHLERILTVLKSLLNEIPYKNNEIANKLYSVIEKIKNDGGLYSDAIGLIGEVDLILKSLNTNVDIFKDEINKPIKKPKCDFDAEIAKDIILDINNFENLILFSGDGDFASTVEYLIKKRNKKVFVVYPQGSFGEIDYRNFKLIRVLEENKREYERGFVCRPVDHLIMSFTKKEPTDFSVGPDVDNIAKPDLEVK